MAHARARHVEDLQDFRVHERPPLVHSERAQLAQLLLEVVALGDQVAVAWWSKVGKPHLRRKLRRAAEAKASLQAAEAARWDASLNP